MSHITVYSDLNGIYQGQYDIIINRVSQYVDVYISIKEAIAQGNKLVVVVRNSYCLNYIGEMVSQYGEEYIKIKDSSPRKMLSEILGIEIPNYINDEDIIADKLLSKVDDIIVIQGMNFDDIILHSYLGSYFANDRFLISKMTDFLFGMDIEEYYKAINMKIVKKAYNNKLNTWENLCDSEYESNILKAFKENPKELLNDISKYLIVKNYPSEFQIMLIGNIANDLQRLRLKEQPFILGDIDIMDIKRNIRIFFNKLDTEKLTKVMIEKYITMTSGILDEELDFILDVIEKNDNQIDEGFVEMLKSKFENLLANKSQYKEKISRIIPPQIPKKPKATFTTSEWLDWALKEYLPYKFWLEETNRSCELIDQYASMYGDWIYENYHQLLTNEPDMLYKTLTNLSQSLSKDELSLIVMVDNYNFKYVPFTKEYLNSLGYNITIEKPLISMIPTETLVSKTAFFSGEPYGFSNKSYEKRCLEWEGYLDRKVKYISDIGQLDKIYMKEANIYFLNYISIDRILHEGQRNLALSTNHRIQEELKAMIDKIVFFAKRIGFEDEIKLYFISDHGSTKISHNQINLIESKYFKETANDTAHRYISLSDKKFELYKESLESLCYPVDKDHYGTQENYLIAKNYFRFINIDNDSAIYVHGGITPEENIIPLLKFEKIKTKLIEPDLTLLENEFRYSTLSNISLSLKNYNTYDLNNIEIIILNNNIQWDRQWYKIKSIAQCNEQNFKIENIRIMKNLEEDKSLVVRLKYEFLGSKYQNDYNFNINIKSIQENKVDLNNLF